MRGWRCYSLRLDAEETLVVLEAERGLVALCYALAGRVNDVERGEDFHRVVVPVGSGHFEVF